MSGISTNIYQIPAAKALMGAALFQYALYAVIYIIEGFKLQEFEESNNKFNPPPTPAQNQNPEPDHVETGENKEESKHEENEKPIDLREIAMNQSASSEQNQPPVQPVNTSMSKGDEGIEDEFEMPFLMLIPRHYQRSTIWFMVALGLCAVRAPNDLTIAVAYIQVVCRIIQMIGAILHKRRVSQIAYLIASICIVILFIAAMVKGASDEMLPNY